MTGIIGSGFGLYGYLPAVCAVEKNVCLLSRAKDKFFARKELNPFHHQITWAGNEELLLEKSDTVILSLPPAEQERLAEKIIFDSSVKNIILEKPVATTPEKSKWILEKFKEKNYNFRISYSFIYLGWFQALQNYCAEKTDKIKSIHITWNFKAHHFQQHVFNWKRDHEKGGGVIRFFGIHLVGTAGFLNFDTVICSRVKSFGKQEFYAWQAEAMDSINGLRFFINVDSFSAKEKFSIILQTKSGEQIHICDAVSPFDALKANSSGLDKRANLQAMLLSDLHKEMIPEELYKNYIQINNLWNDFEEKLIIEEQPNL